MTHLRRMMLEELQRRNYAKSTVKAYIRIIQEFASHFHRPPDRLGPQHLRQYQSDPAAAAGLVAIGDRSAPKDLDPAGLAAWTSVARVILNLHETIVRE